MRRRGAGIAGLQRQAQAKEQYREAGYALATSQFEQLNAQLDLFRTHLTQFSQNHQLTLRKDPVVRARFLQLCSLLDVDPLAVVDATSSASLSQKSPRPQLIMQVIEAASSSRHYDGGLTPLGTLHDRLLLKNQGVTPDDILRAIEALNVLGAGWEVLHLGGNQYIQSLPSLLSPDTSEALSLIQSLGQGHVNADQLTSHLGWTKARAMACMEDALRHGICWVDDVASPPQYWVPAFSLQGKY
ncbi:EAP30/Vps36 family-domain-containing protein [Piptocephalis cylindrospora]|uniref:EAP30/Vps36 family-domain-containing protein n=1 Tax=Piptocephalis cylindrospora TaxID=1907219 RepID=A0A4P9Y4G2_9FUNG|nr:EAP30/Vps36 family-domain-containing protein [Piptocephalis cylindrospora]|eukprot:RKP13552.1 EAP30/Vps36 family-domain-containing protein [Piptocephalis cylindrospora]